MNWIDKVGKTVIKTAPVLCFASSAVFVGVFIKEEFKPTLKQENKHGL